MPYNIFLNFVAPNVEFKLLNLDHQCRSAGQMLTSTRSDEISCADACNKEFGCKYFIITASGNCYWEKATDGRCPEGWVYVAGSIFYEISGNYVLIYDNCSLCCPKIYFKELPLIILKKEY